MGELNPVIGVVLMVAITVILAAVIACFVFGMGPSESFEDINEYQNSSQTVDTYFVEDNITIQINENGTVFVIRSSPGVVLHG